MRRRDAAKVARLRAGESAVEIAAPVDDDFETLRQLRVLDERVEEAGFYPLLSPDERSIVDSGLADGRIKCVALAAALGVHRTTIWRRVARLLANAATLDRYGKTLLDEAQPQGFAMEKALTRTYAWNRSGGGKSPPEGVLKNENYTKLLQLYGAGEAARRLLYPPAARKLWRGLEWRGEKAVITGIGPLSPDEREAIRLGKAERIYDPPRCHSCGQFISRPATGRPPKYCSERCRSRYRRQR